MFMNKKINLAIKVCCLTDDVIGEGSLAGILLCEKEKKNYDKTFQNHVFSIIVIIVFFAIGRMLQYSVFGIYASYHADGFRLVKLGLV